MRREAHGESNIAGNASKLGKLYILRASQLLSFIRNCSYVLFTLVRPSKARKAALGIPIKFLILTNSLI